MMLQVDDDMIEMEKLSVDDRYEAHHHEEDDISHLRALRNTLQQTMEVHERRRTHIQVRRVPPDKIFLRRQRRSLRRVCVTSHEVI